MCATTCEGQRTEAWDRRQAAGALRPATTAVPERRPFAVFKPRPAKAPRPAPTDRASPCTPSWLSLSTRRCSPEMV